MASLPRATHAITNPDWIRQRLDLSPASTISPIRVCCLVTHSFSLSFSHSLFLFERVTAAGCKVIKNNSKIFPQRDRNENFSSRHFSLPLRILSCTEREKFSRENCVERKHLKRKQKKERKGKEGKKEETVGAVTRTVNEKATNPSSFFSFFFFFSSDFPPSNLNFPPEVTR